MMRRLSSGYLQHTDRRAIRQFESKRADCEKALVLKAVHMALAFAARIVRRVFAGNLRVAKSTPGTAIRHDHPCPGLDIKTQLPHIPWLSNSQRSCKP